MAAPFADASAQKGMSVPDERSRAQPFHEVFVSYSARDKPIADAVVSRLEQAGIRCWVAPRDVIPGQVFAEAIVQAIQTSRIMVVIVSGSANQSHHVLREVERAVANNVVIVPFCIETIEPSGALAYYLASEHWLDAITPPIEAHIAQLVQVAHVLLDNPSTARDHRPTTLPVGPAPVASPAPAAKRRGHARRLTAVLTATAVLAVLGVVGGLFLSSSSPQPARSSAQPARSSAQPARSSVQQSSLVNLSKLVVGNCLLTPQGYAHSKSSRSHFWTSPAISLPLQMSVVPCSEPHSAEVFLSANASGAPTTPYPGDKAINNEWQATCRSAFKAYVGIPDAVSILSYTGQSPNASMWADGDYQMICIAYNSTGDNLVGSIKGSDQ